MVIFLSISCLSSLINVHSVLASRSKVSHHLTSYITTYYFI
nr:MAG TPA: hypothetical protein [Caudoviricetes sp.]